MGLKAVPGSAAFGLWVTTGLVVPVRGPTSRKCSRVGVVGDHTVDFGRELGRVLGAGEFALFDDVLTVGVTVRSGLCG